MAGTVIWGTKQGQVGAAPPRPVPDLSGKTKSEAERTLTQGDLNGSFTGPDTGHVSSQNPTAGSQAYYGDTVSVTLA